MALKHVVTEIGMGTDIRAALAMPSTIYRLASI